MHLLPAIWTKSLTLLKPEPLIKQVLIILSSTEPLRELRFTAHSFTGLVYCASFYEHRYPERQAAATGENRNLKLAQEDARIRFDAGNLRVKKNKLRSVCPQETQRHRAASDLLLL